ncbi:hypothetical protein Droror1_Dr00006272 [Drosera rotundifolia]
MDGHITVGFQIPAGLMSDFTITSKLTTIVFYDRLLAPTTRRLISLDSGITFRLCRVLKSFGGPPLLSIHHGAALSSWRAGATLCLYPENGLLLWSATDSFLFKVNAPFIMWAG